MDNAEQRRFKFYTEEVSNILFCFQLKTMAVCFVGFSFRLCFAIECAVAIASVIQSSAFDREDLLRLETLAVSNRRERN